MSSIRSGKAACEWPTHYTNEYLDILLEFYRQGKCTGNSLTETVWQEVLAEFNNRTGVKYSVKQLMEEHKRMEKKWSIFRNLISETGGGWNSQRRTVDVPPTKLDQFQSNVELKPFKEKALDRYEDMNEMWGKGTATGSFARSSNNALTDSKEEKGQICMAYARAPENSRRSKAPFSGETNKRRCKSRFRVLTTEGQCNLMHSESKSAMWNVDQCIADVRQINGVTTMQIENARAHFGNPSLRAVYMNFTEEERRIWVFR